MFRLLFVTSPCTFGARTGGQLYLFDRKEVRYFRKDGHVWTKKKDGKAVQEAHEKLKVRRRVQQYELASGFHALGF